MRFMILVKGNEAYEGGAMPTAEQFDTMGRYNDELAKAGALIAADGLQPSSKGAQVTFAGGRVTITDGPFSEAKELVGGFTIIQVASRAEALEWLRRWPGEEGDRLELRPLYEPADFGAELTPEPRAAGENASE